MGPGLALPPAALCGTPQGLLTGGKLDVFPEKFVEANDEGATGFIGAGVEVTG
jgi:hypothetical protein